MRAGSPLGRRCHRPLLVLFLVVASVAVDNFAQQRATCRSWCSTWPRSLLIALPMTLIIVTGEIDLSVATMLGLSSAVMGALWDGGCRSRRSSRCAVLGAVLGAVNGLLVTVLRAARRSRSPSARWPSTAGSRSSCSATRRWPTSRSSYTDWVIGGTGGPRSRTCWCRCSLLAVVFGVVLHATPVGPVAVRHRAPARTAARFAGIRVDAAEVLALRRLRRGRRASPGCSGRCATPAPAPTTASGLELAVVAAVLLGGVSIFGGRGHALGCGRRGRCCSASLQNALRLADVSNEVLSPSSPGCCSSSRCSPRTWPARSARPPTAGDAVRPAPAVDPADRPDRDHSTAHPRRPSGPPERGTPMISIRRLDGARAVGRPVLAVGLTACGGTTRDSAAASPSAAAPAAAAPADPNAPLKEGLKIAFLPKQLNNPYIRHRGRRAARRRSPSSRASTRWSARPTPAPPRRSPTSTR